MYKNQKNIHQSINYIMISTLIWSVFFVATTGATLSGLQITLNLSNIQIGIMSSMLMLFLPLQIVGSLIQEKFFDRKNFCDGLLLVRYTSFLFIMILLANWSKVPEHTGIIIFIALFGLSQATAQLQVSPWFSWMGDLVPKRENNNFWNKRGSYSQASILVSSIVIGLLIDHFGRKSINTYIYMMLLAFITGMISLVLQHMAKDIKAKPEKSSISLYKKILLIWRDKRTKILISVASIQSFFVFFCSPFIFIYLQQTLNFSMLEVQILSAIGCTSAFLSGYLFKIIGNKYGRKPILIICYFLKFFEFMLWTTLFPGATFPHAVIVFILAGFVNIGIANAHMSLLTSVANTRTRSIAVALFFSISGLAGFVSSNFSGVLLNVFESTNFVEVTRFSGFNILAAISSIGYIISAFMFIKFKEPGSIATTTVVRILLTNNPIRSIVHAQILSNPVPEKNRISTLKKATSNIINQELIDDLYNPSSRVRESAVDNISRMKTNIDIEVYESLIKTLDIPSLGIQSEAARALGHQKVKEAIPELYKHIYDGDTSLAFSCIYALGLIGNKDVVEKLAGLLNNNKFAVLWPEIVETLGKTADYKCSERMFHIYKKEYNWTLKKQELIAIIRVFYEKRRETIYSIFEKETRKPASILDRQVKQAMNNIGNTLKHNNEILHALDHENYLESLEFFLMDILEHYKHPLGAQKRTEQVAKFRELFRPDGTLKSYPTFKITINAYIITILLYFWSELKYVPNEFNRFTYLSCMLLIQKLQQDKKKHRADTRGVV
ncbi:MAG: MFS transporter [Kiritimatiellae bacterium]|jgi:MFS family permease|nr:MFS transporter [Kiritimatiellia bacterium]